MKQILMDIIEEFDALDAYQPSSWWIERLADHLLADGVIVPPVKVGQTVWFLSSGKIKSGKITNILFEFEENRTTYNFYVCGFVFCDFDVGKTVFLTKEEAERALAERREK